MRNFVSDLKNKIWPTVSIESLDLSKHCVPLDGVRGLAILLVLCYDCLKIPNDGNPVTMVIRKFAASGWIGVDLFFVLSGFLITGILLDTKGKTGYWKSFFLRRSVRIFPLYYATLLGVFVGIPLIAALGLLSADPIPSHLKNDQWYYWLYGQNWLFALRGVWPDGRILNHFWSLAVEEQFYLIWPLVVAWLSRKSLSKLCLSLCGISLGLRFVLLLNGTPGVATYVMTITRMDSLCMGALLAIALRNVDFVNRWGRFSPMLMLTAMGGLVGVDVVWPILESQSFAAYSVGHTLLALCFITLIASVVLIPQQHLIARLMSFSPLLTLGKYSYAIYVFHRFVYAGVLRCNWAGFTETAQGWLIFVATLLGSILVAQISWKLIEQPCLALKKYFPRPVDEKIGSRLEVALEEPFVPKRAIRPSTTSDRDSQIATTSRSAVD